MTTNVNSIDQILEKIKKEIHKNRQETEAQITSESFSDANKNSEVLELTNIVSNTTEKITKEPENIIDEQNLNLISKHIRNFTSKINSLTQGNYVISEKEVSEIFKETLQPYLKSWLNNNLEDIVKEVLETEIKKILKKII